MDRNHHKRLSLYTYTRRGLLPYSERRRTEVLRSTTVPESTAQYRLGSNMHKSTKIQVRRPAVAVLYITLLLLYCICDSRNAQPVVVIVIVIPTLLFTFTLDCHSRYSIQYTIFHKSCGLCLTFFYPKEVSTVSFCSSSCKMEQHQTSNNNTHTHTHTYNDDRDDNADPEEEPYEYVSYISPKTIMTETVYHFLRGSIYGAAYGMVTPFYMPGSPGYIQEQQTGIFKPAPPLASCWKAVPSYAVLIGSILACQRACCKTMEYMRGKSDPWNDTFGYVMVVPYYNICLTKHAVRHNRMLGGVILASLALANWP
jgi:hypothetical protein